MNTTLPDTRILMTADTVGGVWTYALELCASMPGNHVILATMGPPATAAQRADAAALENVKLVESHFKLEWMEDPWDDVAAAGKWLLELEAGHSPDIIHLNGYVHAALAWRAPVVVVAHSCVLSWWRAVKHERPPRAWERYRAAVAKGLRSADAVVAPSETMLRAIKSHYGRPPRPQVIPNGVDARRFAAAVAKEPIILTAGRIWDEAKNATAVAAVASHLPWRVVVAGDAGADPPPLPNVTHAGRLAARELEPWFQRASIYALPARYEPFGLSALEAAHAGAALVLGNIPSLREIWGDAAWYVDPDDHDALWLALMELIERPEQRAEMAGRARLRAGRYSRKRMRDAYHVLYQSLQTTTSLP